jgi:hypothetical protein
MTLCGAGGSLSWTVEVLEKGFGDVRGTSALATLVCRLLLLFFFFGLDVVLVVRVLLLVFILVVVVVVMADLGAQTWKHAHLLLLFATELFGFGLERLVEDFGGVTIADVGSARVGRTLLVRVLVIVVVIALLLCKLCEELLTEGWIDAECAEICIAELAELDALFLRVEVVLIFLPVGVVLIVVVAGLIVIAVLASARGACAAAVVLVFFVFFLFPDETLCKVALY